LVVRLLTDWTIREIENLFAGHEITETAANLDETRWPVGSSVRRDLAARYHSALDLSNPVARVRLLRVYDELLSHLPAEAELRRQLKRDGIRFDDDGAIASDLMRLPESVTFDPSHLPDLSRVRDPEVLREHAIRMQRALGQRDPADAVLASRELLESVCKLVLEDYNEEVPRNANLGQLYGQAARALDLQAAAIQGDTEASKAARKVLQGLMQIADGMGELRTRIGRGHGRTETSPARQRHAELATSAAGALAAFILDTWHERRSKEAS
jgi:hypothetical protein